MMHCDVDLLWTLVEQNDEPGENANSIARHLESCASCRKQLAEFGGDTHWWDEARHWLSEAEAAHEPDDELPMLSIDLSFLDQPTHPEMLGRIGRYDVEALIGRGGMGVVLRAYDSDLHRSVAIKVLAPEWAASMQARRRFAREAQAAASVAHENVVPIYNVEADAQQPFLVMQYVPGMTLQSWVKTNGPPDAATILRVAGQMAEGLSAAHRRGLVHRDVKPGNVLVGDNIDRVWITDFGLARAADSITLTRTGVIAGTPHYMSPEQARGEAIDHRSDLFSLGCVLYFLATGKPPFDAENTLAVLHKLVSEKPDALSTHRDDLPPSFVSLVDQLLRRSRAKRPPDCDAVIAKLAVAQEELRSGKVARAPLPRKMWTAIFGIATVLVLAIPLGNYFLTDRNGGTGTIQPESTDASLDPWANKEGSVDAKANPYIVRASQQIDSAVSIDDLQFQNQLEQISRQLHRIRNSDPAIGIPSVLIRDADWGRKLAELETLIHSQP